MENKNPKVFQNVKVLVCALKGSDCHYGYPSAGAIISSLVYQGKIGIYSNIEMWGSVSNCVTTLTFEAFNTNKRF